MEQRLAEADTDILEVVDSKVMVEGCLLLDLPIRLAGVGDGRLVLLLSLLGLFLLLLLGLLTVVSGSGKAAMSTVGSSKRREGEILQRSMIR